MKKIASIILLFASCLSLLFIMLSCSDNVVTNVPDGYAGYVDYNLKFILPENFAKRNEGFGFEIVFTSDDVRFQVDVIPIEDVESDTEGIYGFHVNSTADDFAKAIINANYAYGLNALDYSYDQERSIATFYALWWPEEEDESKLFYFVAGKGEYSFFLATYMCSETMQETYLPLFREWASYIEIVE